MFGLQTQFGGGKTTGFALIYDSPEALKKFEPHYRLVRVGFADKIEKPSRQQRTSTQAAHPRAYDYGIVTDIVEYRQATQEQTKDSPGYGQGQGCKQEEGVKKRLASWFVWKMEASGVCWYLGMGICVHTHFGSPSYLYRCLGYEIWA